MPSFDLERGQDGPVVGIDEAGRGPLAGPVIAAAVILDRDKVPRRLLRMIDDSKVLTAEQRERAEAGLRRCAGVTWAVAGASVEEIDTRNILQATFVAMRRALARLPCRPMQALVDGNADPRLGMPVRLVIGGDGSSYSIAAASIIAKVTRDRLMCALALRYPGYSWESNKGYGSLYHMEAIERLGLTPHHRKSFAPAARLL